MTDAFDRALKHTLPLEGRYSDRRTDRGGRTMWGITESVARANGYRDDMRLMPQSVAVSIYRAQYWDTLRSDDVADLSEPIAAELFDTGINQGIGAAGQYLQRALNALNRQARDYGDLAVDGVVGPMTVEALRQYLMHRPGDGESIMLKALNCLQGARYIEIAERDPAQEDYVNGWLRARVKL